MLKMYIAVLDEVPCHMVPTLVAHTVINAHRQFEGTYNYQQWLANSFKKVVVSVNRKEFEKIAELQDIYGGYENTTLDGQVSCIVVNPRQENPKVLTFAKMWKPKQNP